MMKKIVLTHRLHEAGMQILEGKAEVDIDTAKNAGLPCLSVTWGFREEVPKKMTSSIFPPRSIR